jgi:hypothetical protein
MHWSHDPVTTQSYMNKAYETFYVWNTKLLLIFGHPYFEQSHSLTEPSLDVDTRSFFFGCSFKLLHSSICAVNSIYFLVFLVFLSYSYHPIVPRSVATKTLPGNKSKLVVQSSHLESALSVIA